MSSAGKPPGEPLHRQVVLDQWQPGDGGHYDRISAIRAGLQAEGGIGTPHDTPAQLEAKLRGVEEVFVQYARQDPNDFIPYVATNVDTGAPVYQERMHHQIQRTLDLGTNVAVEAFRGSGKTTQWAYRVIHDLGRNPDQELVKVISESSPTAVLRVNFIRNNIDYNRRIRNTFPSLVPHPGMAWGSEEITVARSIAELNPSLQGFGIGSQRVGGRVRKLIGDDATPPDSLISQAIREGSKSRWNEVWAKMLTQQGLVWFFFTPWHQRDLGAQVRESEAFVRLRFAVGGPSGCESCPENGGAPCNIPFHNPWSPRAWPAASLEAIYKRDGSLSYGRSHKLVPISSESTLFPYHLFPPLLRPDLVMGEPGRIWRERGVTVVFGMDLALGGGASNDWVVIFVLGFDTRGNKYIIDIIRFKSTDYRVQIDRLVKAAAKYRPELIYVESTQFQRILTDNIRFNTSLPVRPFYPLGRGKGRTVEGADKKDLRFGVPSLRIGFENGKWIIPTGNEESKAKAGLLIEELSAFTVSEEGKVEGVGSHDDIGMGCWIADGAARKLGAGLEGGDEDPDALPPGLTIPDFSGQVLADLGDLSQVRYPSTPAALGVGVPPGAGKALQVQVPLGLPGQENPTLKQRPLEPQLAPRRPPAEEYVRAYHITRKLSLAEVERLPDLVRDMGRMPTMQELLRGGFSPRFAGTCSGLAASHGVPALLYLLKDVATEQREKQALEEGLEDVDEDDLLFAGLPDEDDADEGWGAILPGRVDPLDDEEDEVED